MSLFSSLRKERCCAAALLVTVAYICAGQAVAQGASRKGGQAEAIVDAAFQKAWSSRAMQAEADGRWSDAADAWAVLGMATPRQSDFSANARRARERAQERATELTRRGEEAVRRADVRRAMAYFLGALSALPGHEPAQRALRQLARRHPFEEPMGSAARTGAKVAEPPVRSESPVNAGVR